MKHPMNGTGSVLFSGEASLGAISHNNVDQPLQRCQVEKSAASPDAETVPGTPMGPSTFETAIPTVTLLNFGLHFSIPNTPPAQHFAYSYI